MKKLIIALTIGFILLSCHNGYDTTQVELESGEIINVLNDKNMAVDIFDSVIIERYVSLDSAYGFHDRDKLWGTYKGVIPEESFRNSSRRTSRTWYVVGVVVRR